jgi:hypothetical protein
MFWVQYEASQSTDPATMRNIMEAIANIISPFPLAFADVGPFGKGVMVCDPANSNPGSDEELDTGTSGIFCVSQGLRASTSLSGSSPEVEDSTLSSEDKGGSRENHQRRVDPRTQQRELFGRHTGIRTCTVNEGTEQNSYVEMQNLVAGGGGGGQNSAGRSSDNGFPNQSHEDQRDGDDDVMRGVRGPSPTQTDEINNIFSGTVTLRNQSLNQDLKILVGLRVEPSIRRTFADCRVIIDLLSVVAAPVFSDIDNEESFEIAASDYFYILDEVSATLGSRGGTCETPFKISPSDQFFVNKSLNSSSQRFGVGVDATFPPRFVLSGSKQSAKTVDSHPRTLFWKPKKICPGASGNGKNDYYWQYEPVGSSAVSLESSSKCPPTHEATIRVSTTDLPKCMRIGVQAIFRKHSKLAKIGPKSSRPRNFSLDLRRMHVKLRLEIKVENFGDDYFMFPTVEKEGAHLHTTIAFSGDEIGAGKWKEISGPVSSVLTSKTYDKS